MTIKQQGGVFGRHPTFSSAEIDGPLNVDGLTTLNVGVDGPIIDLQKNGSSVGAIGASGTETYVNSTGTLRFRVADNVKASLNSVGAFYPATTGVSDLGLTGLRWRDFYLSGNVIVGSGKGIDFSATSGTGTSELFDDYEEGTWTPASATNCTVNGVVSAFYTKVGRMVHCYCYVNITTTGLNFTIAGLPYVCTNGFGPASLYYLTGGGIASIYGSQQNYVNNGSSDLKLGLGATVTGALVMLTASYYN